MKMAGYLLRFRKRLLLPAMVLTLLASLIPALPALAAPTITVSPSSGAAGTLVTITGVNFDSFKGDSISIAFDQDEIPGSPIIIPDTGVFAITFTIPGHMAPGVYSIDARIQIGTDISNFSTTFRVLDDVIELNLSDGTVGTELIVNGNGFLSGRTVTVYYHNVTREKIGTVDTSATGSFTYKFTVPASFAGVHKIAAENAEGNYAETTFEVLPSVALNLSSGSPGSLLTVSGKGFAARSQTTIYFGTYTVASVKSDEFGNFSTMFNVPEVKTGTYDVKAQDALGNLEKTRFSTTAGAFLNPSSGHVGSRLTVRGIGFNVGETVTVDFDDLRTGTVTADNNGAFSVTFTVPVTAGGVHVITVSDGTISRKLAFQMESEAPPVPGLLLPSTGSMTTAAAYLDWEDVDDASLPVTYNLQLASDENFSGIELEKIGLTASEYTLTEEEWLAAGSTPSAYFWRVSAADSAGNESEWSVLSSFFVSAPPVPELFWPDPDIGFDKTVYLNWQDVSSLSPPVYYTVQIASDIHFKDIIIEEAGLDDSEYFIPNIDDIELFIKSKTYHWRVKAVDSVNNESEWTAPASFLVASTFVWPPLATYLLIGLAVIIIVYLAFRLGKRTATQPPD
jgi:hypothetical protein